jgi:pimeloyl-ACP methyl ester carboxylesterase
MTPTLFSEVVGRAGAPPLILVHGFGATNHFWRKIVPDLARDHEVHALELMGLGRSPMPADGDLSPLAQGRALVAYLRRLRQTHPGRPVLVGHSLGGAVVMIAALELIDRGDADALRGLIIMSGAVFPQRFPPFIRLARTRGLGPLLLRNQPPRWAFRIGFRTIVHDASSVDAAGLEGYREPLAERARRQAILQAARQLDPSVGWDLQRGYPRIALPLLALWGQKDRVVHPAFANRLARMVPQGTATLLPLVGHLPPEEAPAQTLVEMRRFLSELTPAGAPPGLPASAPPGMPRSIPPGAPGAPRGD